ncbi:hypothetical protein [Paenibacillus tepidiphilus]|uniref:hypothetical protein n=1 Tax=Paenibacillus tepidiphilus TaxID=2608683 RepID=UPI001239B12D|nr:hypothetical protein [Paenibacillus tepidiphilus]
MKSIKLLTLSGLMLLSFSTSAFAQNVDEPSTDIDTQPTVISTEQDASINFTVSSETTDLSPYYDLAVPFAARASKLYVPPYSLGAYGGSNAVLVSDSRFYPNSSGTATLTFTQWDNNSFNEPTVEYVLLDENGKWTDPRTRTGEFKDTNSQLTFTGLTNQLYALAIINHSSYTIYGNCYIY